MTVERLRGLLKERGLSSKGKKVRVCYASLPFHHHLTNLFRSNNHHLPLFEKESSPFKIKLAVEVQLQDQVASMDFRTGCYLMPSF